MVAIRKIERMKRSVPKNTKIQLETTGKMTQSAAVSVQRSAVSFRSLSDTRLHSAVCHLLSVTPNHFYFLVFHHYYVLPSPPAGKN